MKKVSLILTTYNCKDNLIKTLKSIEEQDYPNIEVVIKDGASIDGTVELIKEYCANSHNNVKYVSKKDNGIYDAMNQGYMLSSGDIIAIFNECYTRKDAISKIVKVIEDDNESCIGVHTDLIYVSGDKVFNIISFSPDCFVSIHTHEITSVWQHQEFMSITVPICNIFIESFAIQIIILHHLIMRKYHCLCKPKSVNKPFII